MRVIIAVVISSITTICAVAAFVGISHLYVNPSVVEGMWVILIVIVLWNNHGQRDVLARGVRWLALDLGLLYAWVYVRGIFPGMEQGYAAKGPVLTG